MTLIILSPTLLFVLYPPKGTPAQKGKEPVWLTIVENIGRIVCFLYPIVFGMDVANALKGNSAYIYPMAAFAVAYYCLWARYRFHGQRYALLVQPLLFIPVPMAVFPMLYFLAFAALLQSLAMGAATIVFAAAHISISLITYRQLQKDGSTV